MKKEDINQIKCDTCCGFVVVATVLCIDINIKLVVKTKTKQNKYIHIYMDVWMYIIHIYMFNICERDIYL